MHSAAIVAGAVTPLRTAQAEVEAAAVHPVAVPEAAAVHPVAAPQVAAEALVVAL